MRTWSIGAVIALTLVACKKEEKKAPSPAPSGAAHDASPTLPEGEPRALPHEPRDLTIDEITPPPPRPASVSDAHLAAVDKANAYFAAMGRAIESNRTDCDEMARDLEAADKKHAADLASSKATLAPLEADAAAQAFLRYREAAQVTHVTMVMLANEVCSGHTGVAKGVAAMMTASGATMTPGAKTAPAPGWTGPRPPGIKPEHVAAADDMAAWFGEVLTASEKVPGDCPKIAAVFKAAAPKGKAIAARLEKAESEIKGNAAADKWMGQYTGDKIEAQLMRMMSALGKCMDDPAVKEAMKGVEP